MKTFYKTTVPLLIVTTLALAACGKKEEATAPAPAPMPAPVQPAPTPPPAPAGVTLSKLILGSAIDDRQNVTTATNTFAPTDTIYAAVSTTGAAPGAALAAKWTYQDGQVVNQSTQTIAPSGTAVTTFHIAKPDGWPAGKYTVEITIDGKVVGNQDFEVK